MHVLVSRLLFAAILAVGLSAGSAWAGGRGDGKGPCGTQCPYSGGNGSRCDKPCHDSSYHAGCPAEPGCEEDCDGDDACDDNCCDDDCSCEGKCSRCGDGCQDIGDDDGDDDDADDDDCDAEDDGDVQCADEDGCCDGWFFRNWFKSWNASSKDAGVANKNFSPGMKCEQLKAAAKFPYQLGQIYGGAVGCKPTGHNAAGCTPPTCYGQPCYGQPCYGPPCYGQPCGVVQTGAATCACKCACGKCECSKDKQAACQAGANCPCDGGTPCGPMGPGCGPMGPGCGAMGPCWGVSGCCPAGCGPPHGPAKFISAPVPPPPPAPPCPVMGPHAGIFHKLADVMAENAALHARMEAKEDFADEQECLRAALTEARQEIVRLTAAQQNSGNKDQVLVEWIKSQSESAARKDEMLVEIIGAVVEMHAAKSEASASEKLEAKVEKLQAALEQVKEENAKLRTQVSQHKRSSKRVSTPADGASCHGYGPCHGDSPVYKVEGEPVDCPK